MRNVISFMHVSLDGFVSGPNGEMDWIKVDDEIFRFVGDRIKEGDIALYGRKTYQMMEAYWPTAADKPNPTQHEIEQSKRYKEVHKIDLSETLDDKNLTNTTIVGSNQTKKMREIKNKETKKSCYLEVQWQLIHFKSRT